METIHKNVRKTDSIIEKEIHLNPNTKKREFSLRGYYLTITEYHKYEG